MTTTAERQATASVQPTLSDRFEVEPVATTIAEADCTTATGFEARRGARLIEGRRPATWLDDAIAREYEITRRMGLLDPKPSRGGGVGA
jgi:hypothetical protein